MKKAAVGALVATTMTFGAVAAPAGAHEGRDGDRGRSERVESVRGERDHRDGRHDKDRRGDHGDRHRGDRDRGDRRDWDRGDRRDWDRGDRGDQTLSVEDEAFLVLAAQIGLSEIFQGQLALARSENPVVQEYARQMVVDHLHQLAAQLNLHEKYDLELPTLTEEQIAAVQALLDTPVEGFDAGYVTAQVVAHEQALALFTAQAENGENWKVTKFARKHVPVLEQHLDLAEAAQAALGLEITPAA